jgi:hypothetical protein
MNIVLLVTLSGPMLAAGGWFGGMMWLFWVGVAVCVITLLMDLASGAMKLPVLPLMFMAAASGFLTPWYVGIGVGIAGWTALDGAGAIIGRIRATRA